MEISPRLWDEFERYKREHPEEYAAAQRYAMQIHYEHVGVITSTDEAWKHINTCAACQHKLGFRAINTNLV